MDAPPEKVVIADVEYSMRIDSLRGVILVNYKVVCQLTEHPQNVKIGNNIHEIHFNQPSQRILIDGESCEMDFSGKFPVVIIIGKKHGILFDAGPREILVNGKPWTVAVDKPKESKLAGTRRYLIALGGPGHEVIIDDQWYVVKFNGPEVFFTLGFDKFNIQLKGPVPFVRILGEVISPEQAVEIYGPKPEYAEELYGPKPVPRILKITHLNSRSAHNKCKQIKALITDNKLDVCALTETWFTTSDPVVDDVLPAGYKIEHIPRATGKGGGVAVIYRNTLSVENKTEYHSINITCMEYIHCLIKGDPTSLCLVTVYRPPHKTKLKNTRVFLKEFRDLLDDLTRMHGKLLLVGDLNFHFDNPTSPRTKSIIEFLSITNHQQHVAQSTHEKGHILDVIITRRDEQPVENITCDESVKSDHFAVIFTVPLTNSIPQKCAPINEQRYIVEEKVAKAKSK